MMKQIWLMEPNCLQAYLEKIESVDINEKIESKSIFDSQKASDLFSVVNGEAVLRVVGVLNQSGPTFWDNLFGFEVTGYDQLEEAIESIKTDKSVKAVRMIMDTPGGEASGCDKVYQALISLNESKPITAYNCGMIASAGYWLATAANKIVATSPTNETGSIGVIIAGYDIQGYREKLGLKFVKIRSKNAPNKAPGISNEKDIDLLKERINAIERLFISRVAEGRNVTTDKVIKEFGQGGVFVAQDPDPQKPDALKVGMIDEVMSMVNKNKSTTNKTNLLKEVAKVTLQEMLAQHPELQSGIDALVKAGHEAGFKEGMTKSSDEIKARAAKASPILKSDEYPGAIKELAMKVVNGESDVSALDAAVAVIDSQREANNSIAAATQTDAIGDTPPDSPTVDSDDGIISSEEGLAKEAGNHKPSKQEG